MNIRHDGKSTCPEASQNPEALLQTRSAVALAAGAVRLVEGGFEHVREAGLSCNVCDRIGHPVHMLFAFYHAWPGEQDERARFSVWRFKIAELNHASLRLNAVKPADHA